MASCRSELPGVVGQCVEHKEGQHPVGLHLGFRRLHVESDALHLEAPAPLGYDVEEGLQLKALYLQCQLALAQLNPVGQYIVVVVNLGCQLTHIVYLTI